MFKFKEPAAAGCIMYTYYENSQQEEIKTPYDYMPGIRWVGMAACGVNGCGSFDFVPVY